LDLKIFKKNNMLKILLVDDSKSAQLKIYDILSQYGNCDQAFNGLDTIGAVKDSLKSSHNVLWSNNVLIGIGI
jgi:PleD family two-component response regulator